MSKTVTLTVAQISNIVATALQQAGMSTTPVATPVALTAGQKSAVTKARMKAEAEARAEAEAAAYAAMKPADKAAWTRKQNAAQSNGSMH